MWSCVSLGMRGDLRWADAARAAISLSVSPTLSLSLSLSLSIHLRFLSLSVYLSLSLSLSLSMYVYEYLRWADAARAAIDGVRLEACASAFGVSDGSHLRLIDFCITQLNSRLDSNKEKDV